MKIGIIGGSGLENADILENVREIDVNTPYGRPSSKIKKAFYNGADIYIISRHGFHHEITPSMVNNRANIHALKELECKYVIATTAVGSLREEVAPGYLVIPDQLIDNTKHRKTTFYDDFIGGAKHTSLAIPFSESLRTFLINTCQELNLPYSKKGTLITIEGPRFSTRAESNMFRQIGADIINMSTAPEAILAKEAGLEYAVIAMSTDYDCWKITEEPVTWEQIDKIMKQNASSVKKVITRTIETLVQERQKQDLEYIKSQIRTIPNFPKPGIMFRDITTLLNDSEGFKKTIDILYNRYKDRGISKVVGMEARGFIFGAPLAEKLDNCGFVPIRKKGKLPGKTVSKTYALEYGTDTIEIHEDSIKPGEKVLLVDDLIATGGTLTAGAELIEILGGKIHEIASVIDLPALKGKAKLTKWPVYTMIDFEGD
jgi:5'-methylthioadenosine phosphorylase